MKMTAAAVLALSVISTAHARPVSYEGGWTAIEETNRQTTSLLVHYTPHYEWSVGLRSEWNRREDYVLHGAQATHLVNRWFGENYQGNLYAFAGAGVIDGVGPNPLGADAAAYVGVSADWETRRWFLSYTAQGLTAGEFGETAMQAARVGVAPYIGDTGDLHTWLMVEVDQRELDDRVGVTPMLRFFKGVALLEVGWSLTDDQPLANFTYRF